ncbi:MAG: DUF7694 domain-containing protein [Planctomycetota bacterium]
MKNKMPPQVEKFRIVMGAGNFNSKPSDGFNGCFHIPITRNRTACIVCSDGDEWDHVSVHVEHFRPKLNKHDTCTPTWEEMCMVKTLFFDKDEWVMQLHPPASANINIHEHTLHLWRPQKKNIPRPPTYMV